MVERILTKVRQTVFNYGDKQVSFTVSMGLTTPQVHRYRSFKPLAHEALGLELSATLEALRERIDRMP
jgi:hypothetical protein